MSALEPPTAGGHAQGLSLVGYRGSGKTSVGRMLAGLAKRGFLDSDAVLENEIGSTIAKFFEQRGEPAFRALESELLHRLVRENTGAVIATGGGAVLRAENRAVLRAHGIVVWLNASPATIAERLEADPGGRPSLTGRGLIGEIDEVLRDRAPIYRSVSDLVVETDGREPIEIAAEIEQHWRHHEARA